MQTTNRHKIAVLYSGGKSIGGIEGYLLNLFKYINKEDFDIELLSLGSWKLTKELENNNGKVKIFNSKRIRLKTVDEIGEYCKEKGYELLVSQGVVANAYGRLIARKHKITNLVTVHSDQRKEYGNPVISMAYSVIDKLGQPATEKYIAVSKYIKSRLEDSGVRSDKIAVIYNGVDFPAVSTRAHKRLIIGSLGRLNYVKGFDILIQAFSLIENKRLRMRIAGEGEELQNLKQLATDLNVADRVDFMGYKKDVYEVLDKIDVYVQPSRSEGFGIALVTAMSQDLPVVVTPAGAMTEIVTDGQTGYISADMGAQSLAREISRAVDNIEESTKIGLAAGKYVRENYSIKTWIKKTEKAYAEAIK